MLLNQGENERAQKCLNQALTIFQNEEDWVQLANTHIELGWAVYLANQPTASLAHFRQASALAEAIGLRSIQAHALTSLTHVMVFEGAYTAELKGYIEESIALCQQLGDSHNAIHALLNLSTFHTQTGEYEAAIQVLHNVEAGTNLGLNAASLGWVYATLAELLLITDQWTEVGALLDKAQRLFQASGIGDGLTMLCHHRGELARKEQRWADARVAFKEGERRARAVNNERVIARCLMGLGRVALAEGEGQVASRMLTEAATLLARQPAFLPPVIAEEYRQVWLSQQFQQTLA